MANRVQLRSKWGLFGLMLVLFCCQSRPESGSAIPNRHVSADSPGWQQREGKLWLNNEPFSGWQYQCSRSGDTLFTGSYLTGKAEGIHQHWYPNRQLKEVRHYRNGWQEGEQRGWHESGKPLFVTHFQNDVYEGSRKEWYANGQSALDGTYHDGHENGPQKQWFDDGTLKANYTVREGRTYGFTGVKNCVNVWDSVTVAL
ncbi:toxin-antitoxin system YwqK family antitoxin [Fibrella aquatica]|uniref:toxin-antitoxin system YwqK family antitoxin n=1 Tax=Fibrella aquatica TaxID=3242487 RepID=UPI003521AF75